MEKIWLMLTSITYAIKAQKLLEYHGIHAYIGKTPSLEGGRGCGYSLRIRAAEETAARTLLQSAGIRVLGTQREGGDAQ